MQDFTEDGVDVSLIRWMLSLTPAQRLEVLQSSVDQIEEIREYRARGQVSRNSSSSAESQG